MWIIKLHVTSNPMEINKKFKGIKLYIIIKSIKIDLFWMIIGQTEGKNTYKK